jgi:hypothetical protein
MKRTKVMRKKDTFNLQLPEVNRFHITPSKTDDGTTIIANQRG